MFTQGAVIYSDVELCMCLIKSFNFVLKKVKNNNNKNIVSVPLSFLGDFVSKGQMHDRAYYGGYYMQAFAC